LASDNHMELEQIIGQLFLLGFQGSSIDQDHPIRRDIETLNLGGVILFDRLLAKGLEANNIISADQVKALTRSLQTLAPTPLFICVDQEGGLVTRLKEKHGFPRMESAAALSKQNDPDITESRARTTAKLLFELGINVNFAPVVDVNITDDNPVIGRLGRSFSSRPEEVTRQAEAWIRGHQYHHVLSCAKHFPGHGSSRDDSHLGFVEITNTWQKCELEPFRRLIQAGLVEMVMTGHLFHAGLDATYPATLSRPIIQGLLREQLGYSGLVISDDLQMKAITDRYGLEEAVCLALDAGVDLLIIGNNLAFDKEILPKLITSVMETIADGRLSEQRIRSALHRVQAAKHRLNPSNHMKERG